MVSILEFWLLVYFLYVIFLPVLNCYDHTIYPILYLAIYLFVQFFLGPHLHHMEIPGLRAESELQLQAYPTATATPEPSSTCNLHCSLQQCQILNLLSKVRDWICILTDMMSGS